MYCGSLTLCLEARDLGASKRFCRAPGVEVVARC
jgi:hypothetical protein